MCNCGHSGARVRGKNVRERSRNAQKYCAICLEQSRRCRHSSTSHAACDCKATFVADCHRCCPIRSVCLAPRSAPGRPLSYRAILARTIAICDSQKRHKNVSQSARFFEFDEFEKPRRRGGSAWKTARTETDANGFMKRQINDRVGIFHAINAARARRKTNGQTHYRIEVLLHTVFDNK